LSCDFKLDGKISKIHKKIFQNTTYNFRYIPQSYLYSGMLMLFASFVFLFIEREFSAVIMMLSCAYSFVLYYKSKLSLEKQEI
jgi:hypothetical protein